MTAAPTDDRASRTFWRFGFAVPVALVLVVWASTLHHPFVFDDFPDIVEQRAIRNLWPPTWATYTRRQLVGLSFALNWAWTGQAPWSYRLVNVAIHATSAALVWGVVRRGLLLAAPARYAPSRAAGLATAAAALWATHALHTSAVTYVVHRYESAAGLFLLAMIWAWQRARTATGDLGRAAWVGAAAVFASAAMLCKEVAIVGPVLLAGYDAFATRGLPRGRPAPRALALGLVAAIAWAVFWNAFSSGTTAPSQGAGSGLSRLDYFRSELAVLAYYVRLALVPWPLSVDYCEWPIARSWLDALPGVAFVATAAVVTLVALVRAPAIGFTLAAYFVVLAPTSSVVPLAHELVAERRMYLPLLCVVVLVVLGLDRALAARPRALAALVAGLVVASSAVTLRRNHDFRAAKALFAHDLEHHPDSARLHFSYAGAVLAEHGSQQEAWAHYERTVALDATCCPVHRNMGALAAELGKFDEAERHMRVALAEDPSNPMPWVNAIAFLASRGRHKTARRVAEQAVARFPDSPDVAEKLAWVLATAKDPELVDGARALALAQQALALGRGEPPPISRGATLAAALAALGRLDEAADLAGSLAAQAATAGLNAWADKLDAERRAFVAGRRFVDGDGG